VVDGVSHGHGGQRWRVVVAILGACSLVVPAGPALGAEDGGHSGGGCGGGGGGGGHTAGPGNNVGMPVIWAEPDGVRPELRGEPEQCSLTDPVLREYTTQPLAIPPEATYVMVGEDAVFLQQEEVNEWQAESAELADSGLPLTGGGRLALDLLDWGDNLEAKDWSTQQMVRVETRLLQDVSGIVDSDPADPDAPAGMTGFLMRKVGGSQTSEMWGVVGTQVPADPSQPDPATDPWRAVREQRTEAFAYTQGACLTVERIDRSTSVAWDAEARAWTDEGAPICVGDVAEGPGGYGAEVTVSGGLTYGYVWHARGAPAGLYRLTFSLKPGSGVDLTGATEIYASESTEEGHTHDTSSTEGHAGNTAVILPDLDLSYIDVGLSYDDTLPSLPLDLTAQRGVEQVSLTWAEPISHGSSAVSEYVVSGSRVEDGAPLPERRVSAGAAPSVTFEGLAGGEPYTFLVAAVNGSGAGSAATVTATPRSPAPAPPEPPAPPPPPRTVVVEVPVAAPDTSPPTARVRVKAVSKRSKIRLNVNPNVGRKSWQVMIQKKSKGTWRTQRKIYRTKGKAERLTINRKKGKYRVLVLPNHGHGPGLSKPVRLRR
jgi:hypothetical protein